MVITYTTNVERNTFLTCKRSMHFNSSRKVKLSNELNQGLVFQSTNMKVK